MEQLVTQVRGSQPAVTKCDRDGVSCGLLLRNSTTYIFLALLANETSLPLDKAASNLTAIGESKRPYCF
jgi:hypothetical protein